MYIGPFYFDKSEIFLLAGALLIAAAMFFKWPLWEFKPESLLTLFIITLFVKGLMKSTYNDAFFFHSITAFILTLFVPIFYVILFYCIAFLILRIFKIL